MTLVAAPDLDTRVASGPSASTALQQNSYVISLASLATSYAAAASAPDSHIYLFDKNELQSKRALQGHKLGTTSIRALDNARLVSSGKDGRVVFWDERKQDGIGMQFVTKRSLLCCDVSSDGMAVAAGSEFDDRADDAVILYWDTRNSSAPLRTHASTHSDDITVVRFLPPSADASQPSLLLSASSDSLLSISNSAEDDEDEAVLHVANWGCSIAQAGCIPCPASSSATSPRVWAASDMETFSTWSSELDPVHSGDLREPTIHGAHRTWVTDYLVGCEPGSAGQDATEEMDLRVYVGSNEGDVALMTCRAESSNWTMRRLWTHGHSGIVRSALYDDENRVLLTGGEDGKLCWWRDSQGGEMEVDIPSSNASPQRKRELDVHENEAMDVSDAPEGTLGKRPRWT